MNKSPVLSYRACRACLACLPRLACLAVLTCHTAGNAIAQSVTDEHPGAALFQQNCSSCHVEVDAAPASQTAPTLKSLQTLTAVDDRVVDLNQIVYLAGPGVDISSTRNLPTAQAGLTAADLADLELAWALAFPDVNALRASPLIVGSTIFFSATGSRKVLALDAEQGCAKWVCDAPTRLRSSLTCGSLGAGEPNAIIYGDGEGIAAGGGLLLVNSGYGRVGGTPGNVLLAFKPGAR